MLSNRRSFLKKVSVGTAGIVVSSAIMGMKPMNYRRIIGANERLNVAIIGLGGRYSAFIPSITNKYSNVNLLYLCDVMEKQRLKASKSLSGKLDYKPKLENDLRRVFDDTNVDAVFISTPDHWHTPGAIMAMKTGKHVYLEKPCSHNMYENELIVKAQEKYNRIVQMGNQQRSSSESAEIISEIHNGIIGTPYKALAYYVNQRAEVPVAQTASVPLGLVRFTNGYKLRPVERPVELIDIWNNSHQVIEDKLQVSNLVANDVLFLKFSEK